MNTKQKIEPQNPLILRCHRLMEAFAKSDDERDFYLDRLEGFLIYIDLDKSESEITALETEINESADRYVLIPKLTFYETKKIMEGFVNEKVYDIDTKEKLLDIIQSKEARENFLEFLYDHHTEFEKWQQYYQERSRVRIIEWLRQNQFQFVFEEDLDVGKGMAEKLKHHLFDVKVGKDILNARKALINKSKTYYSNEALNPRPKRGRPPKQVAKAEIEPQLTEDIYTKVPSSVRPFLFKPDISSFSALTFSSKFDSDDKTAPLRRHHAPSEADATLENLNQKLASLRNLSSRWIAMEAEKKQLSQPRPPLVAKEPDEIFDEEEEEDKETVNGLEIIEEEVFASTSLSSRSDKESWEQKASISPLRLEKLGQRQTTTSLDKNGKILKNLKQKKGKIVKTATKKPASKSPAKKAPAKKAPVKKAPAKKAPAKKAVVKKAAAKKTVQRKAVKK